MKRIYTYSLIFLILFLQLGSASAATNVKTSIISPTNQNSHNIHVGLILQYPFVIYDHGQYSGIAIDIWQRIAIANHWHYEYVPLGSNIEIALDKLSNKNNNLDIIIGPISVTSERLQKVEFTRPFFLSSIGVITKIQSLSLLSVMQLFFSEKLFIFIAVFILWFLVYINLLWYFERGKLPEMPHNYSTAIKNGMWLHLLQRGFSIFPTTALGKFISLIWIFSAGIMITSITANYMAAYTVILGHSYKSIVTINDFQDLKIAGVDGQISTEDAEKSGAYVEHVKTFDDAINLLTTDQVDGVVCDSMIGSNYIRSHRSRHLLLNPLIIHYLELAFATKIDNQQLKHKIDLGITALHDNNQAISICKKYIGANAAMHCNL